MKSFSLQLKLRDTTCCKQDLITAQTPIFVMIKTLLLRPHPGRLDNQKMFDKPHTFGPTIGLTSGLQTRPLSWSHPCFIILSTIETPPPTWRFPLQIFVPIKNHTKFILTEWIKTRETSPTNTCVVRRQNPCQGCRHQWRSHSSQSMPPPPPLMTSPTT